ncbi:MAG: CDP-alcohol phosphatidyltransferase family protein [Chloroflexi bacterium]|nr:MAG: CDP-alcohol phosphatidyltransferase family protein [Chloroflexota bacterium]
MLDHYLRGTKDYLLNMLARPLYKIPPNLITVVSLVVGLAAGVMLAGQLYLAGFLLWALNRLLDGLDGAIARETGQQTDFGGYLDILADFVVYAVIPIALVVGQPSISGFLVLAFLLAAFYVNSASWMYLSAILEKRKHGSRATGELTTVTMPEGLIGGAETVLFFSLFIVWPQQLVPLFVLMAVLVLVTAGQRLVWAARHL